MLPRSLRLLAIGLLLLGGCTRPPRGGVRLWQPDWRPGHAGAHWVSGVTLDRARTFSVTTRTRFRSTVANTTDGAAEVVLTATGRRTAWPVAAGGVFSIEADISPGSYTLSGAAGLVAGEPRAVRESARARLVVLVLVDALRDDHVTPRLMPRTLASLSSALRFADATANSTWTLPSLASAFTAQPVLDLSLPDGTLIAIPEGVPTLAGALHGAGFSCGGAVANYSVHVQNGFGAPFDSYLVPDGHGAETPPDATWVVTEARRFLATHRREDAFLFLHFMDVHEPYRDHRGSRIAAPMRDLAPRTRVPSAEEASLIRDLYAGDVSYLDGVLGPFLAELPPDATVVLTADHGESLGEHGCWAHGFCLSQEALRVPLLIRGPGVAAGHEPRPVQLVDLAPTVLALAGVEPPGSFLGRSLLAGGSSVPIVTASFSAGPLRWAVRDGNRKATIHTAPQPALGGSTAGKALEGDPRPTGGWLFDLARDPKEEHPQRLEGAAALWAAHAFARSAGRLVEGLQLLVVTDEDRADLTLSGAESLTFAQAFSAGPVRLDLHDEGVRMVAERASPFTLIAWSGPRPRAVLPGPAAPPWIGAAPSAPLALGSLLGPPDVVAPGSYLWWNERPARVQRGQEETIQRLRNLGYLQ